MVFRRPPLERADYSDLVKRVIGLPGDTISSIDGRVYIDGRPLDEPWLPDPAPVTSPSPLPYAFSLNRPYTVPAGEYYVMGDNRTDSEDSRYFGPISGSLIVGKMAFVVWPLSDSGMDRDPLGGRGGGGRARRAGAVGPAANAPPTLPAGTRPTETRLRVSEPGRERARDATRCRAPVHSVPCHF